MPAAAARARTTHGTGRWYRRADVVTKDPQAKGFSAVKRRWVVERTLGWLMHHRRLVRDYEARPDNSASMITLAMIDNLANVSPPKTPQPGENH